MLTRTLAASFLAIGLLSPMAAYAASPDVICDNKDQADYKDCNYNGTESNSQGFSAPSTNYGPVIDDLDRRSQEKNDNSGNGRN
jgi:hypothetical protein